MSIIEEHYKLVRQVLIGEVKSAMKNKGKITKSEEELDTSKTTTVAYKEILGIVGIIKQCSTCTRIDYKYTSRSS